MLLEAAMSELREDASALMLPEEIQSNSFEKPGKMEGQSVIQNMEYASAMHNKEEPGAQSDSDNVGVCHDPLYTNGEVSLLQDDHSKGNSVDMSSSSASSSVTSPYDNHNNNNEGITVTSPYDNHNGGISLLQEDNEFVSRVLNREPSNLGESNRFGSYRSTAAVAAEGVPFQWEAKPGKSKNPTIMEEEEQLPPLSLPPIRLSTSQMPPHMSPSSSAAPSPRSLTGKMRSLIINHVKKPSIDHFSFTNILEPQKSPSKKASHRRKRGRKNSSLSASEYGSVANSPYVYSAPFKNGNMQKNEESYAPRASLNSSSDPCSSPYYFSPLSNTSSLMNHGGIMSPRASTAQSIISPRASTAQSSSGSTISISYPHAYHVSLHTSSRGSDSSVSSVSSAQGIAPSNGSAMLANCLLSITSMSDDQVLPAESENGDQDGSNSLSFASPEMEIIDEELLTSADYMDSMQQSKPETTMQDFINRGGLSMNRSFSTSRVTFADDLSRKPAPKSQYYSAQLSKSTHAPSTQDPTAKLDVLFPLKRPNGVEFASKYINQSEESPDDRQAYVDALDTSLDCSVMTDNDDLNSTMQSIMNDQVMNERPAHEVVMEGNDENGFAYSPVASAFVFSPKKASQNAAAAAAKHYFELSTRANISNNASNGNSHMSYNKNGKQPKSILKKTHSQELGRAASFNVKTAARSMYAQHKSFTHSAPLKSNSSALPPPSSYSAPQKSLTRSGSQKISSVLLRFAEAEEQLYNNSKRHHGGMRSPAACMQPLCSFLGRALLCRSKLAIHHAGPLHT